MENNSEFLKGFAATIDHTVQEASEQWDAFSRQLSNADIDAIESRGYDAGVEEGEKFNELFPPEKPISDAEFDAEWPTSETPAR